MCPKAQQCFQTITGRRPAFISPREMAFRISFFFLVRLVNSGRCSIRTPCRSCDPWWAIMISMQEPTGRQGWVSLRWRESSEIGSWPFQDWNSVTARDMGEVDVRVIGSQAAVKAASQLIESQLGPYIVTTEEKDLEDVIVGLLTANKATLAVAESCTGGLLANRITDVPGASLVFIEGNVTYSNDSKMRTLDVSAELLSTVGAVSEEVARAMAEGALKRSGATYALSTTGIAGPDGGTDQKPVGTVFIGLASRGSATLVEKEFFPTDRLSFKRICTQHALEMLRRKNNKRPGWPGL